MMKRSQSANLPKNQTGVPDTKVGKSQRGATNQQEKVRIALCQRLRMETKYPPSDAAKIVDTYLRINPGKVDISSVKTVSLQELISVAKKEGIIARRRTAPKNLGNSKPTESVDQEKKADETNKAGQALNLSGIQQCQPSNKTSTIGSPGASIKVDPAMLSGDNPRRVKPGENIWGTIAGLQAELNELDRKEKELESPVKTAKLKNDLLVQLEEKKKEREKEKHDLAEHQRKVREDAKAYEKEQALIRQREKEKLMQSYAEINETFTKAQQEKKREMQRRREEERKQVQETIMEERRKAEKEKEKKQKHLEEMKQMRLENEHELRERQRKQKEDKKEEARLAQEASRVLAEKERLREIEVKKRHEDIERKLSRMADVYAQKSTEEQIAAEKAEKEREERQRLRDYQEQQKQERKKRALVEENRIRQQQLEEHRRQKEMEKRLEQEIKKQEEKNSMALVQEQEERKRRALEEQQKLKITLEMQMLEKAKTRHEAKETDSISNMNKPLIDSLQAQIQRKRDRINELKKQATGNGVSASGQAVLDKLEYAEKKFSAHENDKPTQRTTSRSSSNMMCPTRKLQ